MADKTASEVLENADIGSSTPENIRNTALDLVSGGILGAFLGSLGAKVASRKPARVATKEAIEQLKNGVDDSLGHQTSLIKKGTSHDSEVRKMMKQNEDAARNLFEGGNGKKALKTVVKNSKREAEIGPRFMDDIKYILQKDTGLSEKEVNKAIAEWMKENANDATLLTLIEAKDPVVTYSHSLGVQDITKKLAKEQFGLSDEEAKRLADAALVHDIGKIQVPDSIINSAFKKEEHQNLFKWMQDHDFEGAEILKSDPFSADIAKTHHPKTRHNSNGSFEEGTVTVADLYEAITSNKRSYKSGQPKETAFKWSSEDLAKGGVSQDYLGFLKALDEDGLLPDNYDFPSKLESPYKSMKANAIKKQVASDYDKKFFEDALKKKIPKGIGDVGAVQSTSLPTLSEVLSEVSPSFKSKAEKLDDIKRWYKNGLSNDKIDKLIVDTDFKDNKEVTKLWKLMQEQFKD
jgi:putative nucleotidyltransferase with HDIG domain